jgi:hypothetical protein
MKSRMPAVCRWIFAICTGFSLIGALAIVTVIVVNPALPLGAEYANTVDLSALPGGLVVKTTNGAVLKVTELKATVSGNTEGLNVRADLFKRFVLPIALIYTIFFAVLFDLLRRLFRNVEHGASFTPQTVKLVRIIGYSLVGFAFVSSAAEGIVASALIEHFRQAIVVSSPGLAWAATSGYAGFGLPFGGSQFFSGLLVLALSEVFRQGLQLKNDSDLTI